MTAPTTHVVVFDVNVYLDVARLLGPPFTWEAFQEAAARLGGTSKPGRNRREDSLRAISVCTSGKFAGRQQLQVWTSAHIDALVRLKAHQADDPALYDEDRGLGWSLDDSQGLVDDLIWTVVEQSHGDTVGIVMPRNNPPLDHEDGLVYAAARECADADVLCERWCVTNDAGFLRASLPEYVRVVSPEVFLRTVISARTAISTRAMRPMPPIP